MNILTLVTITILVVCHAVTGFAADSCGAHFIRNADAFNRPINSVLGDASFVAAFGQLPGGVAGEDLRIATHLEYVERLLRSRDVRALPQALREERLRNLDRLHAYRTRRIFPRNHDYPGERRPCFIDRDGRICAVGYLVEQSAGRDIAERINSRFQYARISQMQSAELQRWLARSGLTIQEAAMIQPEYGFREKPIDIAAYYRHMVEAFIESRYPDPLPSLQRFTRVITQMKSSTSDWAIDSFSVIEGDYTPSVRVSTTRSDGSWKSTKLQMDYYGGETVTGTFEVRNEKGSAYIDQTIYSTSPAGERMPYVSYVQEMQSRISRWWTGKRLDSIYEYQPYRPDSAPRTSGFFIRKTYIVERDTVVRYIWPVIPKNVPEADVSAGRGTTTTVREHDGSTLVRTTRFHDQRTNRTRRILTTINDSVTMDEQLDTLGQRMNLVKFDSSCSCYFGTRYEYDTLGNTTFEITHRYRDYKGVTRRDGTPVKMVRHEYKINEYGDWVQQFETVHEIKGENEVASIIHNEHRRHLFYLNGGRSGALFQQPLKDVVVEP